MSNKLGYLRKQGTPISKMLTLRRANARALA